MKKRIWIPLIALAALLIAAFFIVTDGLSEGANIDIQGVDLSAVPDGNYMGAYEFKRWTNTVTVHVRNHRIEEIEINKDVTGAAIINCSDEIISRVISTQSTEVDAVSGATVTSNAYLKAIENALRQ